MSSAKRYAAMLFVLAALGIPVMSGAQSWPAKSMRIVVPFPPGGANDIVARIVAPRLSERLGQQVMVENRPGASGIVGAEYVAKSAADGYTLLMLAVQHTVAPALYPKMSYDVERDLTPVALLAAVPMVVVVRPTLQVNSIAELIAFARAKPGALNSGSSGNGGAGHLSTELFKRRAGVDFIHIPYKGSGPAVADLLGGQIDLMFVDLPAVIAHIKAGKLRALAVCSKQASALMPDLPTVSSNGLPDYEAAAWTGIVVPAGTPKDIIARLNTELLAVLARQDIKDLLLLQGAEIAAGTQAQFATHIRSEIEKWAGVVRAAGIKPD